MAIVDGMATEYFCPIDGIPDVSYAQRLEQEVKRLDDWAVTND